MMELKNLERRKTRFKLRCVFSQHFWLRIARDFWRCKHCGEIKTDIKGH